MYLLRMKYAIFFLVLKSATANVDNVYRERSASAKILTKFWKVPWTNLNSSWAEGVAPSCADDISTLFRSADDGHMWALQMLDASTKIPVGILKGNIYDLGMYDECVKVTSHSNPANIPSQYCRVSFGMPSKFISNAAEMLYIQKLSPFNPTPNVDLSFGAAVCLPSSCGVDDVAYFVNASIRSDSELSNLEVRVVQVQCSSVKAVEFTPATILVFSFFGLFAAVLMFCTACGFLITARSDLSSPTLETLAKFSLYANLMKLTNTKVSQGSLPAIHGLRFINTFFIVCAHRLLVTIGSPFVNLGDIYEFRNSPIAPFGITLPFGVDTFFLLAGFHTTYSFLKKLNSGDKFSIIEFYIHRYLRITPCVAAMVLFHIFILPYIASGPLWGDLIQGASGSCQKNWWTNLLFVQNLINTREICMPHSWYLATEMQYLWISPIILYPLFHRPKLGLLILTTFLIASFITPIFVILVNRYAATTFNSTETLEIMWAEFREHWVLPHCRGLPYFIGILCGYFVVEKKRALTAAQTTFSWIMASLFILFCVWNASFVQPISPVYHLGWELSYASVGHLAWSLAMAWIVCATSTGSGGTVGRFLSLPIFVPLSRLSFCIYLVSFPLQCCITATTSTAEFYLTFRTVYLAWGDLAMSTMLAFALSSCVETPLVILRKLIYDKRIAKSD